MLRRRSIEPRRPTLSSRVPLCVFYEAKARNAATGEGVQLVAPEPYSARCEFDRSSESRAGQKGPGEGSGHGTGTASWPPRTGGSETLGDGRAPPDRRMGALRVRL